MDQRLGEINMLARTNKIQNLIGLFFIGLLSLLSFIFFFTVIFFNGQIIAIGSKAREKILIAIPSDKNFYETAFSFVKTEKIASGKMIAVITPHHLLAADLMAQLYHTVGKEKYETIVLIGPNHYDLGPDQIEISLAKWRTPYGLLLADSDLGQKLIRDKLVKENSAVFTNEHSIQSQVSFIKKIFPNSFFLPLILKSSTKPEAAARLAQEIIKAAGSKRILIIASVDFSHQTNNLAAQINDQISLKAIDDFNYTDIYKLNVDSPPSLYTLLKYCQLKNGQFELIKNSNSALLSGHLDLSDVTSYITGVFVTKPVELAPTENKLEKNLRLLFLGDVMIDRHVGEKIIQNGFAPLLQNLVSTSTNFFAGLDLVSANLEGAVTDRGQHYPPNGSYDFAFAPDLIAQFRVYGFNFFNIANNHLSDQGELGILETRKNLAALGFNFSGCPDEQVGACSTTTIEIYNKKIGLAGFSQVSREISLAEMTNIVSGLASSSDLVIVNLHWGKEYKHEFSQSQQKLAQSLIDAGADIIIGHHPHVVQGVEVYKNKPIFYSLGNFIFDQYFSTDTQEELAVIINWQENQINFELVPLRSIKSQPSLMAGEEKDKFLEKFLGWSEVNENFKNQIRDGTIIIKN